MRNAIILLAAVGVVSLLALGMHALSKPPTAMTPVDTGATFSLYPGPVAVYRSPGRNVILLLVSESPPEGTNNHTTLEQKPGMFGNALTVYGLNGTVASLKDNQRNLGILATPSGVVLRKELHDPTFIDRINLNIFDVESFGGDDPSAFMVEAFEAIKDFRGEYPPNYVPPKPRVPSSP